MTEGVHYIKASTGCWLWVRAVDTRGYGHLNKKGRIVRAHRAAWVERNGSIPKGLCVLHKCDVRACINPAHLFLGTYTDNRRDCLKKGRSPSFKGAKNPRAKLSEQQAREILESGLRTNVLAKRYKISPVTVRKIKTRISWRHL